MHSSNYSQTVEHNVKTCLNPRFDKSLTQPALNQNDMAATTTTFGLCLTEFSLQELP